MCCLDVYQIPRDLEECFTEDQADTLTLAVEGEKEADSLKTPRLHTIFLLLPYFLVA